jgi:cytoskeletal protein CcmA (bactofilin family)
MKKKFLLLVSFLALFFSPFLSPVSAQDDIPQMQEVIIGAEEVIERDYLAAGDNVKIYGTIEGDLYVAGGQVIVEGEIEGDVLAAGGLVDINGTVGQDIRVAGGQVTISGEVGQNLTALGGNVNLDDDGVINGSVVGAGGNLTLRGSVGEGIYMAAGNLNLEGPVGGSVRTWVGRLTLGPEASVEGDLDYWSDQEVNLQEGANVAGEINKNDLPVSAPEEVDVGNIGRQVGRGLRRARYVFRVISFITSLVVGLLLIRFYPNFVDNVGDQLDEKPWQSVGVGLLTLFLAPMVFFLMMLTFIGLPIALILGLIYGLMIYLSKFFIVIWAGRYLLDQFVEKVKSGWALFAGLLAFNILLLIPFVGFWVRLFTLLFGLGALLITWRKTYLAARKEKLI